MYVQNWSVRPNKKGRLLDVLKIIFIFHLNVFQLQFKFMRKIVICLLSEKHFNFMIWNFMTLFEGRQNYWILFVRDFEILAPSWIDSKLLIKLRGVKHDSVWKKKISMKNLERAKPDTANKTLTAREGRADELGEYVWFVKLVWFDLLRLIEARWLKQFFKIAFTRIKMV